jgi:hypothetical protein
MKSGLIPKIVIATSMAMARFVDCIFALSISIIGFFLFIIIKQRQKGVVCCYWQSENQQHSFAVDVVAKRRIICLAFAEPSLKQTNKNTKKNSSFHLLQRYLIEINSSRIMYIMFVSMYVVSRFFFATHH